MTIKKMKLSFKKREFILLSLFMASLLVSVIMYVFNGPGRRMVFLFESYDSNFLYAEERFIPKNTVYNNATYTVDELLLGPITDRYKPLFKPGLRAEYCFLRGDILFVNLPQLAALPLSNTSNAGIGCSLLEQNIYRNNRNIKNVELFILGNKVNTKNFVNFNDLNQ